MCQPIREQEKMLHYGVATNQRAGINVVLWGDSQSDCRKKGCTMGWPIRDQDIV